MTPFQQLQAQKIISCYNNSKVADQNMHEVGLIHDEIENQETTGYQELENEQIVDDFDSDNTQ